MKIEDVARFMSRLEAVRCKRVGDKLYWRYQGRLVARQLNESHIVIRADFAYRDGMTREFPATFSVPAVFRKHMMIVADLSAGDPSAIEDAILSACELQAAKRGR